MDFVDVIFFIFFVVMLDGILLFCFGEAKVGSRLGNMGKDGDFHCSTVWGKAISTCAP